ncbi:MAG: FAD-dependent oxidoreductase [Gammaproteobacteria bacterium]
MKIGIAGAGLAGRLLALASLQRGWNVTLFDSDDSSGQHSCGFVAAGMLAPYTESESCEPLLCTLGLQALDIWPDVLKHLSLPVTFHRQGTLVVSHPQDATELLRFKNILDRKLTFSNPDTTIIQQIKRDKLEEMAPDLAPIFQNGFWLPTEGHINTQEFYLATTAFLRQQNVAWHEHVRVKNLNPFQIELADTIHEFDLVCDCRGLGAKNAWPKLLRGIRGELIWLQTSSVTLKCPIRLLHPRHSIYISPRTNHTFVVGATSIESEDTSDICVESMMELLSTAYTLHPGFGQARVIKTLTQCRPAFADQQPKIMYQKGLLKINGLHRHGYMVGPTVIQEALHLVTAGKEALTFPELLLESEETACKLS